MKTTPKSRATARGYISLVAVTGLSSILLLILLVAYRYSIQTQEIQRRGQVRIDYNHREQAILRGVLSSAPNRGMRAMMAGSGSDTSWYNTSRWRWVFEDGMTQAKGEYALTSTEASVLEMPATLHSGNTGDGSHGHIINVVTPIGTRATSQFLITPGINGIESTLGDEYPESLDFTHPKTGEDADKVIITSEKTYSDGSLYKSIPYPDVHFGYTEQNLTFVAKRNWWAFTLALGYTTQDDTGIDYNSKDYVLSIYEVPSQLALGSTGMTYLGQHQDGSAWSDVNIQGSVFAAKAQTEGAAAFDRISTKEGVSLSGTSTVGGIGHDAVTGSLQSREHYEAANSGFYPLSSSADSGLVAFIPIDRGDEAFDDLTDTTDDDRDSPTGWNAYSRPAMQTVMKLRIEDVVSATDQTPVQISFTYKVGGVDTTAEFTKGVNWPGTTSSEGKVFPFHLESTESGRKGISVYMGRLIDYLASVGADGLDVNSSLIVNANYVDNADIQKPNIPSLASDTVLFLWDSQDLTGFTDGFSLVTPFRLYIVDDVNQIPLGVDASGAPIYPPISIFAPEKRFGIKNRSMEIQFDGQLNYLLKGSGESSRPLDLKSGEEESIVPENIKANLFSISDASELPPITQMNWLITIEEVRP